MALGDVAEALEYPLDLVPSLDSDLLATKHITERGETIIDLGRQLSRIPTLEGKEMEISLDCIHPNPDQPRELFDPRELKKLKASLSTSPQRVAIKVVPCAIKNEENEDTGEVILMIVDGERRFKVLKELGRSTAKIIVMYVATEEELLEASLTINEGNAPHNPIERAKAYKKMADFYMKRNTLLSKNGAYKIIADRVGCIVQTIVNHIKLLEQPEDVQILIARGVPPNHMLHLMKRCTPDDKLRLLKVARVLVDDLDREADEDETSGANTRAGVRKKMREALMDGTASLELQGVAETNTVLAALSALQAAKNKLGKALRIDRTRVKNILRDRPGNPPEAEADLLSKVTDLLSEFEGIVTRAVEPDPLVAISGKPKFVKYASEIVEKISNPVRKAMLLELAKASDSVHGKVLAARELAPLVHAEVSAVTTHIRELIREIGVLGLKIETHTKRFKGEGREYQKIPGYRLNWATTDTRPGVKSAEPHAAYTYLSKVRGTITGVHAPLAGQSVVVIEKGHSDYTSLATATKLTDPGRQAIVRLVNGQQYFAIAMSDLDEAA